MPEGDTIHRTATRLRSALVPHRVLRFEAPRLTGVTRPETGSVVEQVRATGKHLVMDFDTGLSLRSHLRMSGSWHLYRTGERWRLARHLARVVLEVDSGWIAVGFRLPDVELFHREAGSDALARVGPDLTAETVDIDAVVERVRALAGDRSIAEVLLDQRIAGGIGNVYKSELCFIHGVHPFTPAADLDDAVLAVLYHTAHELLRANLNTSRRVTWGRGQAVYDKRGQPCPRCGGVIEAQRHGELDRSTYWCPTCQS